ncbi:MAG: hypothetical protein OXU94_04410 [Gammaproteobacteria bacterium]|nr:hypothetical protein [Gammaproteobacteria bacterium]
MDINTTYATFGKWFIKGPGRPGYKRIIDRWLLLHVAVGVICACLSQGTTAQEIANKVIIPLTGLLIALGFSLAGSMQSLLLSNEIEKLSDRVSGGISTYIFIYQLGVLLLLVSVVTGGLFGIGVFQELCHFLAKLLELRDFSTKALEFLAKIILFFLSSLSIRTSWHLFKMTSLLMQSKFIIRKHQNMKS